MSASEGSGRPSPRPSDHETILLFPNGDFHSLIAKLYSKHPGHWVALEMLDKDPKTGLESARFIARHRSESELTVAVRDFHAQNPAAVIRVFSTDMARTA